MPGFVAAGFSAEYLLPVSVNLTAVNKTFIEITRALVPCQRASSSSANDRQSCAAMVYVSSAAHGFYLSCEAMFYIGLVPVDCPSISPFPPIPTSAPFNTDFVPPTINRTVDSVPVTLGAYRPSLRTTDPAHAIHALSSPIAQWCFPSTLRKQTTER